ncbi:MAG: hypothetical protein NXH78_07140 [Hyphomonadaceae bacterium]|nr:hypothetical protein [Hyphomonadaceae bacterium]
MRTSLSISIAALALAACAPGTSTDADASNTPEDRPDAPPELEVIATGANIAGANGIHFGPDGLLYIASVIGSDLTVIDPESGEEIKRFTAADGVIGPDDVAFSSDGSFYWTSILTGEVAGFNTAGEKVVAAQLPPGPNPITFSNDDRLFVSQCFLGTNVYELDPTGAAAVRLIADDLGPGCGLNGMDWGPDNRLYGPRWFAGEVISLDVDTGDRRVEATGFQTPAAIKFDSEGVLHVLDTGTGDLIRVNDGANEVVASLSPGLDNFAFDAADTAFVSSYADGFIKRVNKDGTLTTLQPGGMAHPGGLAVIGDTVWVADVHAVRGFDHNTGEEIVTQRNVVGMGELGGSLNLSADGDLLILSSWFDGDVRIWDPQAGQRVARYPNLAGPVAAVRYAGGLAIAEHLKGAVTLYGDADPVELATGLPAPTGLFVSDDDALYVSDRERGEILLIARDGEALSTPETIADGLESPEGFVVSEHGVVIVEAAAARVVHIDAEGTRNVLATIPSGSPGAPGLPPSQIFNGVAMDADGNLFITGETSRVLYRLKAPW